MNNIIVFQSDFGLLEGTVSQMYGVAMQVSTDLKCFDLTHNITQFNTWEASYSLYQTMHAWPEETVFVSVVDPGVGSVRKSVVVKTNHNQYIVSPNNGSLTHIMKHVGIKAMREIDESINRLPGSEKIHIFHGRDVYAYTGARLASGTITFEEVGPQLDVNSVSMHDVLEAKKETNKYLGMIDIDDPHFGMLWTNIPVSFLEEDQIDYHTFFHVIIRQNQKIQYEADVEYVPSFAYVAVGAELIYLNEIGNLAIATNLDSFKKKYQLHYGIDWTISLEVVQKQ